jgi:hypothetical protein
MTELTKEHFEKYLDLKLGGLANKKDLIVLEHKVIRMEGRLIKKINEGTEELARMVARGFDDIQKRLDVRDRVDKLEIDMSKIKGALNLV